MKRLLIAGDSTVLPRLDLPYEKTWPFLLKQKFPNLDIIDRSQRGGSTEALVTAGGGGIDFLELYGPHSVILQLGITECAPRLFKKHGAEHLFLNTILPRSLRPKYVRFVKKRRTRNPEITDVSPRIFEAHLNGYFTRAAAMNTEVIVIAIAPVNSAFLRQSPHGQENVDRYNEIYREVAQNFPNVTICNPFKGMSATDMDALALDAVHYNEEGARMVYGALEKIFSVSANHGG